MMWPQLFGPGWEFGVLRGCVDLGSIRLRHLVRDTMPAFAEA